MTRNDDPANSAMPTDEQFVAYLDGELDAEDRRRFEELLASNSDVRRRLRELEQTWDLLDDLDTPPASGRLTQTTLEMVAMAASQDAQRAIAEAPRRRRRRLLAIGGGLLAATAIGFLSVAILWPDPDRQLLENLPVLENLDEYRQIDDIDFLCKLRDQGLFSEEKGEPLVVAAARPDDSLAGRRHRIEDMNAEQLEQLSRLQDRFKSFNTEQQQRLQKLDNDIRQASDAPLLLHIMQRYYEWIKTLPSYTRTELLVAPPAKRIQMVKRQLQEEQKREGGKRPDVADMDKVWNWMGDCVNRHEDELLKALPESRRNELARQTPQERRRSMITFLIAPSQRWPAPNGGKPPLTKADEELRRLREKLITDDDLQRLRAQVSPETRERLETRPPTEQWKMVAGWMRRQRFVHGPAPKADDERLLNFFENELSGEERDRLLNMPGDEMQRALEHMYWTRTKPQGGPGRRPDGASRNHSPGNDWFEPQNPGKHAPAEKSQ